MQVARTPSYLEWVCLGSISNGFTLDPRYQSLHYERQSPSPRVSVKICCGLCYRQPMLHFAFVVMRPVFISNYPTGLRSFVCPTHWRSSRPRLQSAQTMKTLDQYTCKMSAGAVWGCSGLITPFMRVTNADALCWGVCSRRSPRSTASLRFLLLRV